MSPNLARESAPADSKQMGSDQYRMVSESQLDQVSFSLAQSDSNCGRRDLDRRLKWGLAAPAFHNLGQLAFGADHIQADGPSWQAPLSAEGIYWVNFGTGSSGPGTERLRMGQKRPSIVAIHAIGIATRS